MRSRLARFVGGSAAAHGVLLAVVLIVPLTRHRVAPIQDTMMVALAGPIGGAAAAAARTAPASAAPQAAEAPRPKEAHTVREVPVPKAPKAKEKPDKLKKEPPKIPPETIPTPEPTDPSPAAKPGAEQGGTGTGPAPAGGATGVTASVGGGDAALGWYGAAVKAALESAWAKPYLEDQGETFSVVVAFDIARDGSTRNVRIVSSSGVPSLDRSVLRAVIEASPLPAVPPTWTEATLPATMRFDLNPESR